MIQNYLSDKINPGDLIRVREQWLSDDMKGNHWYLVIGYNKFSSDRVDIHVTDRRRLSVYTHDILDIKKVI